jgi:hypothetical protein
MIWLQYFNLYYLSYWKEVGHFCLKSFIKKLTCFAKRQMALLYWVRELVVISLFATSLRPFGVRTTMTYYFSIQLRVGIKCFEL